MLIRPIFEVLAGLALAGWVSSSVVHGNNTVILVIWIIWALLPLEMIPLTKVTDMSFQRSVMGQLLGYGQFIFESAGQNQAMRIVDLLPHPEQLYLEVCGLIFKEQEENLGQP